VRNFAIHKDDAFFLFSWLIWGNVCFNLFETIGGPNILGLYLQDNFHVSNLQVNILFSFIPMIMGTIMTPIISFKSDRTRSRFGRRIPYMLFTAPFLVIFAAAIGFSDDIIAYCKVYFAHSTFITPFTAALLVIGFIVVGFSFFNEFVGTVYYYLCPDVMPKHFLGRFQGVAQMAGMGMGIITN
jgi:MFS family permease